MDIEEPASDGGGDTLGVELALERAREGGHPGGRDAIADELLRTQTQKLRHELHHLKLRTVAEWFSLILKGMAALVAAGALAVVGSFVFDALTSRAQVVAPFHVPPDMAEKGLDGSVLAGQVLDKLNLMYASTEKEAANSGYSGEQATETKLEIPETGVSLGELQRLLQTWLGHDVHISGSLVRQKSAEGGDQLVLTTRTGASAKSFSGSEAELDRLTTEAAESVYAATQPLPYADYLRTNRRAGEQEALLKKLTSSGTATDRAWAYAELGAALARRRDIAGAQHALDEAVALNPNLWVVWNNLADLHAFAMNDEEQALVYRRKAASATDFGGADANSAAHFHSNDQMYVDEQVGDFSDALRIVGAEAAEQRDPGLAFQSAYLAAYEAAYLHDRALSQLWARRGADHVFAMEDVDLKLHNPAVSLHRLGYWQAAITADWVTAAREMAVANAVGNTSDYWQSLEAIALVATGQLQQADALLQKTPRHCFYCGVARGLLAEARHDRAGADAVFGMLAHDFPSIVRGQDTWGRIKLARGDYDGAIAVFTRLNRVGPHFADAIEGWGEALLRKGDIAGAAKKFAVAAQYAPGWGHLRLASGIALKTLGKKTEAEKQFAAADGLALSREDRALLEKSR